jgi:hypothetical protein
MWKNRFVLASVLLASVMATALVGLASIRGEPARQPENPPAGKPATAGERHALPPDQPYTMKLSNGLDLPVYPADPLHKFETTDWIADVPLIIRSVNYDAKNFELTVTVDFTWFPSDEEPLRKQLQAKYVDAGHNVSPEAITITKLIPEAYRLILRDGTKDYELFSTDISSRMTAQTIQFHLPMMTPEAEHLHRMLSSGENRQAIQLVLRSAVKWDRVSGLTLERRALASAWSKVREIIKPPDGKATESMLVVGLDADQEVRKLMGTALADSVHSFGLTPEEESALLAKALDAINATKPTTLSIAELLQLEEDAKVWTIKQGQVEAAPATVTKALTELKEVKSREEELDKLAESVSDLASNSSFEDTTFHREASKLLLDAHAGSGFILTFEAGLHLDKSFEQLDQHQRAEFKASRAYVAQKSAFKSALKERFESEEKGKIVTSDSMRRLLDIRRVSAAALASQGTAGWTFSRVNGSDLIWTDTPLPLVVAPPQVDPDVVAAIVKRIRELESQPKIVLKTKLVYIEGMEAGGYADNPTLKRDGIQLSKAGIPTKTAWLDVEGTFGNKVLAAWAVLIERPTLL